VSRFQAAECLDDDGAQYPRRINYMYNPPHLAVEALELHYRIHASILKRVTAPDASSELHDYYKEIIAELLDSPFTVGTAVQGPWSNIDTPA